jgi:hypothetical protein
MQDRRWIQATPHYGNFPNAEDSITAVIGSFILA